MRHVLVFGSGRSGTTWIGDVLASCDQCYSLFEPMRPASVEECPGWGEFSELPGPFLPADAQHEQWHKFWTDVLNGKVKNRWTRQDWRRVPEHLQNVPLVNQLLYSRAKACFDRQASTADTCIIKEIRCNLMLPWILKNFQIDPLFIMRHPCAVVGSRIRLGWECNLEDLYVQPGLQELLAPWADNIKSVTTSVERMAVLWCIENLVPLRLVNDGILQAHFYEHFKAAPEAKFRLTTEALGLRATPALQRTITQKVSTPSSSKKDQAAWHHPLSHLEGEAVVRIARSFGIEWYGNERAPVVCRPTRFSLSPVL
jgi:hypothetical protein